MLEDCGWDGVTFGGGWELWVTGAGEGALEVWTDGVGTDIAALDVDLVLPYFVYFFAAAAFAFLSAAFLRFFSIFL